MKVDVTDQGLVNRRGNFEDGMAESGGVKERGMEIAFPNVRRLIRCENGCWMFYDPWCREPVELDPLFCECNWKVGRLATQLGLGEKTFRRLVAESLGMGAKQWLRQIRTARACKLLREGHKIGSVGRELGFSDEGNFTTEFRKATGISPSAYVAESLPGVGRDKRLLLVRGL